MEEKYCNIYSLSHWKILSFPLTVHIYHSIPYTPCVFNTDDGMGWYQNMFVTSKLVKVQGSGQEQ